MKTKPQLLALLANLNEQTLERSSQFIMSGWVTDGKGNEIFNIPGSEEARLAMRDLKSIYVDANRVDEFAALAAQMPGRNPLRTPVSKTR